MTDQLSQPGVFVVILHHGQVRQCDIADVDGVGVDSTVLEQPFVERKWPIHTVTNDGLRPLLGIGDADTGEELAKLLAEHGVQQAQLKCANALRLGRPGHALNALSVAHHPCGRTLSLLEQLKVRHQSKLKQRGPHRIRIELIDLAGEQVTSHSSVIGIPPTAVTPPQLAQAGLYGHPQVGRNLGQQLPIQLRIRAIDRDLFERRDAKRIFR